MQSATTEGLVHQEEENARRYTIVGIYNSNENMCKGLEDIWAKKTPAQAFVTLSSPDVAVTNKSDKKEQLPKKTERANGKFFENEKRTINAIARNRNEVQ